MSSPIPNLGLYSAKKKEKEIPLATVACHPKDTYLL
jgi:hypothetical protein